MYIRGWDTTINLSNGEGQCVIIDDFNGFEITQIITSPSDESMLYTIQILNTDFNLIVFERVAQGKFNELITIPSYGHNVFRVVNAVPSTGSVVLALRFRVP